MIKAQSNKEGYQSIKSYINNIEDHSIHYLKNNVRSEYTDFTNKFPHLTGVGHETYDLFNMESTLKHDFFS
mgnify:CR=1 FL=1